MTDAVAVWTQRLQLARQIRRGVIIAAGVVAVLGIGMAGWILRRPPIVVEAIRPELPLLEDAAGGAAAGAFVIPEALFRLPRSSAVGKSAAPTKVASSTGWRVLGVDLTATPPTALLRTTKDGPSVWVHVGDHLEGMTVAGIQSGQVALEGPDGTVEIRL